MGLLANRGGNSGNSGNSGDPGKPSSPGNSGNSAIPASQAVRATPATRAIPASQAVRATRLPHRPQTRERPAPSATPAAKAKAYGRWCQNQSKQYVAGQAGTPVPLVLDRDGETGNRSDKRTLDGMQTAEQEAHLRADGIAFQPVCDCGDAAPQRAAQAVVPVRLAQSVIHAPTSSPAPMRGVYGRYASSPSMPSRSFGHGRERGWPSARILF